MAARRGATQAERFIPALGFERLTRLYDPVAAVATRERTFKRRILERARLRSGEQVLDLACGTGTLALSALRAAPGVRIAGVDADPDVLGRARAKARRAGAEIRFDQAMSTDLPYEDRSFDAVLSTLFFHHLAPEAKAATARELLRVLRPGGRLVVGDLGRPQDPLMRAAVLAVQLVDGFETTRLNVAGGLPNVLAEAGLAGVAVTDRLRTPVGTIEILTAAAGRH